MNIELSTWGKRWFEALPIGNGQMGAMVYSDPYIERIDLTENTFFSGDFDIESNQNSGAEAFVKMRTHIQNKDYHKAKEAQKEFIGRKGNYGTNLPVGTLSLDLGAKDCEIKDYERKLSLETGVLEVSYIRQSLNNNNLRIKVQCFASHPDRMIVYRINADKKELNIIASFKNYTNSQHIDYELEGIQFQTRAIERMHSDGTTGVILKGRIRCYSDGSCKVTESGLCANKASYLELIICMDTDFDNKEFNKLHSLMDDTKKQMFHSYLERHMDDFSYYMKKSYLELSVGRDKSREQERLDKVSLLYQYGRYLLLSSSREDSKLPAHLQGIWNDNVACRIGWTCDMHLDINTQMNYWPSEVTNLKEASNSLFRWISGKLVPSGRITARKSYGLSGWVGEIVSNPWGFTAPYWATPISPCPTGGIWILTHIWEHYLFTQDIKFLDEYYSILYEAVEFFAKYVFYDEELGYYSAGPSISPENSFYDKDGNKYQLDTGCTYEILMIRELFNIFISASKVLHKTDGLIVKVKEILPRLLPYQIGEDGSLLEWKEDFKQVDTWHRHTSHLLGLFPFHQITVNETKELAEAALISINQRYHNGENWEDTGWARNMLILYAARLEQGDLAYYHMKELLSSLIETNCMVYHPPTRGAGSFDNVYELDGNTGFTASVAEMLLHSYGNEIKLLPALPTEWKNGLIKGLMARGNIEVTICWEENNLKYAKLTSSKDCVQKVRYKEIERLVNLEAGKAYVFTEVDNL